MPNLYAHIQASLLAHDTKTVIDAADRRLSGMQLDSLVARYANALLAHHLEPGERIAAQIDKSVDNIALYLACLRLGAVYLPLNPAYRSAEVAYFLNDATPKIVVAAPSREAELERAAATAGVSHLLTLGQNGDGTLPVFAGTQSDEAPVVLRDPDDLAAICYTSGTTGRSKGAMITHANLLSNAQTLVTLWDFNDGDVLLHALPLYHIHGLFVALHSALLSGTTILLQNRFDARAVLDALPQATVMMGVPTFYTRLLTEPGLSKAATRNVRLFVSGSAPLLAETFDAFAERTGHRILERYGMTETQIIASNPLHGERRPGTVGLPLRNVRVRIVDAKEGVGVIEVSGPNVFKGYWNMPEKTREEFRDGYFTTGDLGTIEQDGYLRLVGRAKDLIISGGLNVYPKEIEEAIDSLPEVEESAVFAIPHPDFGEAVAAAVTLKKNAQLVPDDIASALRTQLAAFKTPKRIFVVDELPRNAMGKVQKNLLRERYAAEA